MRKTTTFTLCLSLLSGAILPVGCRVVSAREASTVFQGKSDMQGMERLISESGAEAVSVAVHDLATGREVLIKPDLSFHPASTIKLCVLMEVFHQAKQGSLSLEERLPIKNAFHSIVDGSVFTLSEADDSETDLYRHMGQSLPIRDVAQRMITHSSNLATNLLVERVTPVRATQFMRELGARDLLVRRGVEDNKAYAQGLNNAATARGLMQVLVRLAERKLVSGKASDEMLAILRRQHYNEGIPARLPTGMVVAHKTGWNDKLYHDAAIVYPPNRKPYVLVVMTRGLSEEKEAPALVATLSRWVYDHLTAFPRPDPALPDWTER